MKILCMDSSHKHLVIVLIEDEKIIAFHEEECWKKQSETLFPALISLMDKCNWTAENLDKIIITDGPGSYTGVRIAMTVAKVLCTRKNIPLYCLSSLQLLAGLKEKVFSIMDARSKRAYCAFLENGNIIGDEMILTLEEIQEQLRTYQGEIVGDVSLIGKDDKIQHLAEHFKELIPFARKIDNIHILTPRYLKEQEAYKTI